MFSFIWLVHIFSCIYKTIHIFIKKQIPKSSFVFNQMNNNKKCIMICHVSADSSTGTPGSLEHSLDSDSEADEEPARGELQPPSPTEQELDSTAETQMRTPVLLVNLVCPSSPNNNSDPPALPESDPPELYEPEEAAACALAALNINQSNNNNITLWVSSPQPGLVCDVRGGG